MNNNKKEMARDELLAQALLKKGIIISKESIPVRNSNDPIYPSFAQQRLWFLDQLTPDSTAYNLPISFSWPEALNIPALQEALLKLVNRHQVFRSTFRQTESLAVTEISGEQAVKLECVELADEHYQADLTSHLEKYTNATFDLENGPLFYTTVAQSQTQGTVITLTLHHIIADAWSIRVMIRDLVEFYLAEIESRPAELPKLSIQYADYAAWQRHNLTENVLSKQLGYWSKRLAGAPTENPLTCDIKPCLTDTQSSDASLIKARIQPEVLILLKALAQRTNTSLFMISMTAYMTLLYRYTGANDIVIGTPVWNRNHPDLEELIGFFVNTLAIRAELKPNMSFESLLAQVAVSILEAQEYQDVPFDRVIENLDLERNGTDSPLIHSMLSFQYATDSKSSADKNQEGALDYTTEINHAKFDLNFELIEEVDTVAVRMEYRKDKYSEAFMEQFLSHFVGVLNHIGSDASAEIKNIEYMTSNELSLMADQLTGADLAIRPGTVLDWFLTQVTTTPDLVAVSSENRQLTYQELDEMTNVIAQNMCVQGIKPDDVVAIALPRSCTTLAMFIATMKSGAVFLPIDENLPIKRNAKMLISANAKLVVAEAGFIEKMTILEHELLLLKPDDLTGTPLEETASLSGRTINDAAYIIYTSGSTGEPKGVMVDHLALANLVNWLVDELRYQQGDNCSQMAGAAFDAALCEWWPALSIGGNIKIMPEEIKLDSQLLMNWLDTQAIDIAFMPTPVVEVCLTQKWSESSLLRALMTGGDALQGLPAKEAKFTLYNIYGPAENVCATTCAAIKAGETGAPTIGKPVANTAIKILDSEQNIVPMGSIGELYVTGSSLAKGYLNASKHANDYFMELAAHQQKRYYKTGDLVRLSHSGNIEFIGRNDEQVCIHGHRIELGEVRAALHQVPAIKRAYVLEQENSSGVTYLAAYYEMATVISEGALKQELSNVLPNYMVPAAFVEVTQWPLTENGKVDKSLLSALTPKGTMVEKFHAFTETEIVIAGIWKHLLKVKKVSHDDNFFRLGGHSLLATQLIGKIQKLLNIELKLSSIFDAPVLADFSRNIDNNVDEKDGFIPPPLEVYDRSEYQEFPQSFAQQRLFFLDQLQPNSTTYSVPSAFWLEGRLDVIALETAFEKLVDRHELLRTQFSMKPDGEFVQLISPTGKANFSFSNFAKLPEEEQKDRVEMLVREEVDNPFDLTAGSLLRVTVISINENRHFLLVNLHHIVTDAWSTGLLFSEINELYRAELAGEEGQLSALPIQYADYSKWQNEWLRFGVLEELLYYWLEKLRDAPPELSLMKDYPKSSNLSSAGESLSFSLSPAASQVLGEIAFDNNATLFMVLLAGFKTLLYRYTGDTDIVIGTPVANRRLSELESLIGFFINTLVMRTDLSGNPSFTELIARVRETAIGAYEHQDLPYEKLVDQLGPERRWNRSPLFQVMFVFHNAPEVDLTFNDLLIEPVGIETNTAKFDLNMSVLEQDGQVHGSLEFNSELFEASTIQGMLDSYCLILEQLATNPNAAINQSSLVQDERLDQVNLWSKGKEVDVPEGDVCDWFIQQALKSPDNLAICDKHRELSYRELDLESTKLAHVLRNNGLQAGDVIALAMPRSVDMLVGFIAIMKVQAVFLPLDISNPISRIATIIEQATLSLVLTTPQSELTDVIATLDIKQLAYDPQATTFLNASEQALSRCSTPDLPAYVIYTSGSTGEPKGIELSNGALSNLVSWLVSTLDYTADVRASQLAGAAFDASLCEWWPSLVVGGSVHVLDEALKVSPEDSVAWLLENRITTAFFPTNILELLFGAEWPADTCLTKVITGGDVLKRHLPENSPFNVYNIYGPAENACATTCSIVPKRSLDPLPPSIGYPIQNVQVQVLDEQLNHVPVGVVGELFVSGSSMANGYRNNEKLTQARFIDSPFSLGEKMYATGDIVRYRKNGELEFLGRIDDQVQIRGYRIELAEIYQVLNSLEGLKESYIQTRHDIGSTSKLVVYTVVENQEDELSVEFIHEKLKAVLPEYMVPSAIVFLDTLPKTTSGKIDRSALKKPDKQLDESQQKMVEPKTDLEKSLAKIWGELLGYSAISMQHNFFSVGGHSLLAMRLKSEVRRVFNVDLQIVKLFENARLTDLAVHVQELCDRGVPASDRILEFWNHEFDDVETGLLARLKQAFTFARQQDLDKTPNAVSLETAVKSLVPLKNSGSSDPLFIIHPISGTTHCYAELASKMPVDLPVFGLQAIPEVIHDDMSIELLAVTYLQAIKSVQPQGPYLLAGWSLGGVIAMEISLQLQAIGEEVSMLSLIDSFLHDPTQAPSNDVARLERFVGELINQNDPLNTSNWHDVADETDDAEETSSNDVEQDSDFSVLKQKAKHYLVSHNVFEADTVDEELETRWSHYLCFDKAWQAYEPKAYLNKVHLILAAKGNTEGQKSPMQTWGSVVTNGMTIDVFPGDHFSLMATDNLQLVINKLTAFITEANTAPALELHDVAVETV
jgi:amino acid adenylation domain-containing protein